MYTAPPAWVVISPFRDDLWSFLLGIDALSNNGESLVDTNPFLLCSIAITDRYSVVLNRLVING